MCLCNPTFDVRCTCWVNDKHWKGCPQRWATAYWRINNWSEFYENGELCWDKHKKQILKSCKFNESDWAILMHMRKEDEELYKEQDESMH
jgi:hypothetical protein